MSKITKFFPSDNLSFIIQGPIIIDQGKFVTQNLVFSIRKFFPCSEIILSTWASFSNIKINGCSLILFNDDPGEFVNKLGESWFSNINRQIISSKNGIIRASGSICVKIRSDFLFLNDNLLHVLKKNLNNLFYLNKILILQSNYPSVMPYFLPDFVHIGTKENLLKIWNIETARKSDAYFFLENCIIPKSKYYMPNIYLNCSRLLVEQYILIGSKPHLYGNHSWFLNFYDRFKIWNNINHNFKGFSLKQLGLKSTKQNFNNYRYNISFFNTLIMISYKIHLSYVFFILNNVIFIISKNNFFKFFQLK